MTKIQKEGLIMLTNKRYHFKTLLFMVMIVLLLRILVIISV